MCACVRACCGARRSYWTVFTFIGVFGSILVFLLQLVAESFFPTLLPNQYYMLRTTRPFAKVVLP
jgi:hypothetical protein